MIIIATIIVKIYAVNVRKAEEQPTYNNRKEKKNGLISEKLETLHSTFCSQPTKII